MGVKKYTKLKFVSCTKYDKVFKWQKESARAVTCFIVMDMLPLTTADEFDFNRLPTVLDVC